MEILEVTIGGFRNLRKTTVSFSNITAIIGLNNYGKSNLLIGIQYAINFIKADNESKKRLMKWSSAVPINKENQNCNYFVEFIIKTSLDNKDCFAQYGFEFEWVKEKRSNKETSGTRITSEWLKIKLDEKGQKYNAFISRSVNASHYKSSPTGRCSNAIKVDYNGLVINKIQAFDDLYYQNIVKELNGLSVYVDRHLDASDSYLPSPIIRRNYAELGIEGVESIPQAVYEIKESHPEKYCLLEDAFKKLFPNIKEINIQKVSIDAKKMKTPFEDDAPFMLSEHIYIMHVADDNLNQPINFERLSDGAKRVFLLLTYAIKAEIEGVSLLAFEEPENSVHPSLLQNYINILSQLVVNCKLVVASHSPYIINYLNTRDLYVGVPNESGMSDFRRIKATKEKTLIQDAADCDSSAGDYIFQLLSGSKDNIGQLVEYLEN